MRQQTRSTFVISDPTEILKVMVGLKDVRVLHLERRGSEVERRVEQALTEVRCPAGGGPARVKERPVVRLSTFPSTALPMHLAWRKHRMYCPHERCPKGSFVLSDHRIAAKNCRLTTRAAKWATVQVGGGKDRLRGGL